MVQGESKMFVIKRDGRKEPVMFDKITSRIQKLCYGLNMDYIDPPLITMKVIDGLYSGVTTVELDNLAAETAILLSNTYPDYGVLAARIEMSNLHKETPKTFSEVVDELYNWGCQQNSKGPKMERSFYDIVKKNADFLNSSIIYDRDFSFSYFSIKLLEDRFLKKINGKVTERPQHMFMRVAVAIHGDDLDSVFETYNLLSEKWFTFSDLTLCNAGFCNGQMFDKYSLTMPSDSIEGIYDCLGECGTVCRSGGALGLNVHCIRAMGSYIAGTNGTSNGLTPMLRVYNSLVGYTHMGGTKALSSVTVYLEAWHADVMDFITLKKPTGKEEQRAKNLTYALWIPDLFMKRTEEDGDWALMCPNDSQSLHKLWGKEFEDQYTNFENEGRYMKVIKARKLWSAIIQSQIETGGPLMLYKDNINRKSNCANIGTIFGSGPRGDIMAYTGPEEAPASGSAVICLHQYVKSDRSFDFEKLKEHTKVITHTLNKTIDANAFPISKSDVATSTQRPLAIGVQGFADALVRMRYPYESEEAKQLNKQMFETIYFGAIEASCELAEKYGAYERFKGSPMSQGKFQFDLWGVTPTSLHDWGSLKTKVSQWGVRNAVMIAFSPSPALASLFDCTVATEALGALVKKVQVKGIKYMRVINQNLLKDLLKQNILDEKLQLEIENSETSIENVAGIPEELKKLYKTCWEVSQKEVLQMAADRGPFVDQSESLNIRLSEQNFGKITSMHFFGWKMGLKNGMTNLEVWSSGPSVKKTEKVMVQNQTQTNDEENSSTEDQNIAAMVCSLENKDDCLMCGS